jgi:hypothetical protein
MKCIGTQWCGTRSRRVSGVRGKAVSREMLGASGIEGATSGLEWRGTEEMEENASLWIQ